MREVQLARGLLFLALAAIASETRLAITNPRNLEVKSRFQNFSRETCEPGQIIPGNRVDTTDRLRRLRLRMKASSYDAYIIPTDDEHQSEYVADHDKRREFISGFSGSYGTAIVLQDAAALWTDGRYFLQAEQELDCNWLLMKLKMKGVPSGSDWLIENLQNDSRIGADPKLIPFSEWVALQKKFAQAGIALVEDTSNLIDDIWSLPDGRAPESISHIFVHDIQYAGISWEEKIQSLRKSLKEEVADGTVITALDEISWMLNLRGNEVVYTPVFKAYAFVSHTHARLYIKLLKLTDEVRRHLNSKNCNSSGCIQIMDYAEVFEDISKMIEQSGKIILSKKSSYAITNLIPEEKRIIGEGPSLLSVMRAAKNPVEIQGLKNANIRDAVAIVDFLSMLDAEIADGKIWNELSAAEALSKFRSKQKLYRGNSFAPISASGSNAAIIHYAPNLATNKSIDDQKIFLIDSGGQYLDGTTDVTRTLHFGQPTDFQKETYTRVLMGAINLMSAVFPEGVRDIDLDIIARQPLYNVGLDYLHGTGHGIGIYLSVHESPVLVTHPSKTGGFVLKPGMCLSDEPGYYKDGEFGIRLETVMLVTKAMTPYRFLNVEYYTFEPVSFVPFEPKLIKHELLSKKQKIWLNQYNAKVRNTVGVELRRQKRERGFQYLMQKTEFISVDECMNHSSRCFYSGTVFVALALYSLLNEVSCLVAL